MDNRYPYTEEELEQARQLTDGFYRVQDGQLIYGRFFVLHQDYELHRHLKDTYTYPIDGWQWYDSEEQARDQLNCPKPKTAAEQADELLKDLDYDQQEALRRALGLIPG